MKRAHSSIRLNYDSAHILSQALAARRIQIRASASFAPVHKREMVATLKALSDQVSDAITAISVQIRNGEGVE